MAKTDKKLYKCYCGEGHVKGKKGFFLSSNIEHRVSGCGLFKNSRLGVHRSIVTVTKVTRGYGASYYEYAVGGEGKGGTFDYGIPLGALDVDVEDGGIYELTVRRVIL